MATTPRLTAPNGAEAEFSTLLATAPPILERFGALYAELWQNGRIDAPLREMTRLRNARTTDCGYWRNVRFDSARAAGLTEERAALVEDGYGSEVSPREAAALALTDRILAGEAIDPALRARLSEHFDAGEISELALGVAIFLGMSKVLIGLGLEPETMPTTVLPTPGSA